MFLRLAACLKECRQELSGIIRQDTTNNLNIMIENRGLCQVHRTAEDPGLRVRRTKNKHADARLHHRPEAHDTGFQSDVERCSRKAVVPRGPCRLTQDHNFGVGRRVIPGNRSIVPAAEDRSLMPTRTAPTGTSALA